MRKWLVCIPLLRHHELADAVSLTRFRVESFQPVAAAPGRDGGREEEEV